MTWYARDLLDCVRDIRPGMGRWSDGEHGGLREGVTSGAGDAGEPRGRVTHAMRQLGPVVIRAVLSPAPFLRILPRDPTTGRRLLPITGVASSRRGRPRGHRQSWSLDPCYLTCSILTCKIRWESNEKRRRIAIQPLTRH